MSDFNVWPDPSQIKWREPLPISVPGTGSGLACRLCIAAYGLRGADVGGLPQTIEEFEEHLAQFHPTKEVYEP